LKCLPQELWSWQWQTHPRRLYWKSSARTPERKDYRKLLKLSLMKMEEI
jgi:hypothetical protein